MTERTLIPLDGSKFSEAALHYMEGFVEKLEPKEKPEITLLKVVSPRVEHLSVEGGYVDIVDQREDMEQIKAEASDYLERSGENLRSKGAIVHSKVVVNDNLVDTSETIIEVEEEVHSDLVAMSAHNRGFLTKWTHHNTADLVSRKGKVPVLLVRVRE